jgi:hypothetical protein
MVYDRIHIYTKYEDFYFTPNPGVITLMHRNAQKESDGGYRYHVQGTWSNRTPESLVQEVALHTKYRYTESGEYRSEKDIQAEKIAQQKSLSDTIGAPTSQKNKTNTKRWKSNRQMQIQEFRDELHKLCKEHGLNCRDQNQLTYVDNGFEEFLIEFTTTYTKIQSRRCVLLRIKETYDQVYDPDALLPIEVIKFIEPRFTIHNQEEYIQMFYEIFSNRCAQSNFKCKRKGDRISVYATNGTYYLDVICGQPIKIYQLDANPMLVECPEDAHVLHIAHCIEAHDKIVAINGNRQMRYSVFCRIAAISGWATVGMLLAYVLLS